jgi:hypothetical protein
VLTFLLALGACTEEKAEVPEVVSEPDVLPPPSPEPTPEPEPAEETSAATDTGDSGSTDTAVTDTGAAPLPVFDFQLPDENPHSATFGQTVSPRDHLEQVSGWYFIKAT